MRTSITAAIAIAFLSLTYPLQSQAQDYIAKDADVTVWIMDIWEHKVAITVSWARLDGCSVLGDTHLYGSSFYGNECPLKNKRFSERNLAQVTSARVDEEAHYACDFYKRQAIGPLNISRPDGRRAAWQFQYTYACAIR